MTISPARRKVLESLARTIAEDKVKTGRDGYMVRLPEEEQEFLASAVEDEISRLRTEGTENAG